jgi:GntR family transcriptional regulator
MISRDSKVPFYYQLYEILRNKITLGEWQPGDMLPTENELLDRFEVSRSTIRQALDILVNEGRIYRQRGRGTFVNHPTVDQGLSRIVSFTEDMQQRGMEPHTVVLGSGLIEASESIAKMLNIPVGDELARLERLRLADDVPMSIEETFLVHRFCPGVLNRDYSQQPLRKTLLDEFGIRLIYARQRIQAIAAPPRIADKLSIAPNAALLYIERITHSDQNIPVEFIRFYHRGDRYVLHNELRD